MRPTFKEKNMLLELTPIDNRGKMKITVTVELQWLDTLGTMKICSRQGKFELMSVDHSAMSGGIMGI